MQFQVTSVIKTWRATWSWCARFDDRELAEIVLAIHYRDSFAHGTNGHMSYIALAKLFDALTEVSPKLAVSSAEPI